jgi:hypothetical protein
MMDRQLAAFLEEGLASHIASRNANLEPNAARVVALKVEEDRQHVIAYVPKVSTGAVLDDLRSNGQVALVCTRPPDDKGCQVKGVFTDVRDATPDEHAFVIGAGTFRDTLEQVGRPRANRRVGHWPRGDPVSRDALFDQTQAPGRERRCREPLLDRSPRAGRG